MDLSPATLKVNPLNFTLFLQSPAGQLTMVKKFLLN